MPATISPHAPIPAPGDQAAAETPHLISALPLIPVLPGTLLGLDLLVQQPAFDLRAASHLLREDPGALLHLFRLVGEEYGNAANAPVRLDECIASLASQHLLETLAAAAGTRQQQVHFARFALHAAAVGRQAQVVADSLDLPREDALLIGSLHDLGSLPRLLGWSATHPPENERVVHCAELCRHYSVPPHLYAALDTIHRQQSQSVWVAVVEAAHDLLRSA